MGKSDKQLIKSVELDLGGKVVKLTMKQAQALKDALDELFGTEVITVPGPSVYVQPYPVEKPDSPRHNPIVWCSTSDVTGGEVQLVHKHCNI